MRASIIFSLATATLASAQVYGQQNCDDVYNQCIQEYTSKGQAPFFPECNSRRAACAGSVVQPSQPSTSAPPAYTTTTTASAYPTSTSYSAKCQDVYNSCIAEYTSKGQSPFFPECNSRRAACQAGGSYSTGPVPTFPGPSTTSTASSYPTTSYSAKCQDVYNSCIQEYTSKGQSPFFPECNSRRAACQAGSYVTSTTLTTKTTTTQSPVPTTSYSDKCQDVYNKCIQEYTSKGQSPFFPECNSRRAACQGGSTTTVSKPAVTTTTTTTTVAKPPVSSTSASIPTYKPSGTTTSAIATYTGAAATQAPVFGLLAAAGALAFL